MAKGVWRCLKPKAGADLRVTLDQRVTLGAIALSAVYAAIVIAVSSPVSFHTLDDPTFFSSAVQIYATRPDAIAPIQACLRQLAPGMPQGVMLRVEG